MQRQTISKALLATVAGSLFALGASPAFAQDTADLTVKGSIVPAACSANFTGGDTVDFGTIKVVDLLPNSYNSLGSKDAELTVSCSTDKRVVFSTLDMQAGSRITDSAMMSAVDTNSAAYIFGLGTGTTNGSPVNLGGYSLKVTGAIVDGVNRTLIYSTNPESSWSYTGASYANMDYNAGALVTGGYGTTPVQGTAFKFPMTIKAALNKGSALQVAQDTPLNGQDVFTINYQ